MHNNQTAANTKKGNNNNNNVAGGGVLFQRHHHHYLQPFGQELLAKSVNKSSSVKQPSHTKNWVHTAGHQTVVGSIAKQLATASNTNNRWGM